MAKKIRVVFDANPLVRQKTGVGFYTEGLVTALGQIDQLELVGCYFMPRGNVPTLPKAPGLSFKSCPWAVGALARALRKIGLRLPWELLFWVRGDVLLFPDFTSWPSLFKTPKLLTIHDLTFIDHPDYVTKANLRYLRRFCAKDARAAALVLTISKFSKVRLVREFKLRPNKVIVQPIPPAPVIAGTKPKWLPANYLLFISTIEPRKNLEGLIDAYLELPESLTKKYALVAAGGVGWHTEELMERIKHLQASGHKILTPGYVSAAERAALYKNAAIVVVPSFYEGFGMPVLEAFSYNAPVAASNLPVLKEIGQDAAVYFDPNSPASIAKTISSVLSSATKRTKMVAGGQKQLSHYSWNSVADSVFKEIQKLVG